MVRRDSTPTDEPTAGPSPGATTADENTTEIRLFPAEMKAVYAGLSKKLDDVATASERWDRLFDVYDRLFEAFRHDWRGLWAFERRVVVLCPDSMIEDLIDGLRDRAAELEEQGARSTANRYRIIADKIEYQRWH